MPGADLVVAMTMHRRARVIATGLPEIEVQAGKGAAGLEEVLVLFTVDEGVRLNQGLPQGS